MDYATEEPVRVLPNSSSSASTSAGKSSMKRSKDYTISQLVHLYHSQVLQTFAIRFKTEAIAEEFKAAHDAAKTSNAVALEKAAAGAATTSGTATEEKKAEAGCPLAFDAR